MKNQSIFQMGEKWYWYDETWQSHGPYGTRAAASRAQLEYAKTL
jgi:hypothetical protein